MGLLTGLEIKWNTTREDGITVEQIIQNLENSDISEH
jgi:hypothetical protein